ncbi:hypothetical protein JXA32_06635 [Candidatus Sumerlaeota bacterium]|nr:hypothetical protein [Candidatus Sumerlaeota bacterium]
MPYDIWWQLAHGQWILEHRRLISSDLFTFTIAGEPYLDKYWFFECLAYGLYRMLGWNGIELLRFVLIFGCLLATGFSIRRQPIALLIVLSLPALILLELRMGPRGYWLGYWLYAPCLRLGERLKQPERAFWSAWSPLWLLQIAWVNLHGEFFWGLLIAAAYVAEGLWSERGVERWGHYAARQCGGFALMALCCLMNPFGWELLLGIYQEAQLVGLRPVSIEWQALWRYAAPLTWFAWLALAGATAATFVISRKSLSLARLALFLFFCALSLRSLRFVAPMALISIFAAMENGWSAREFYRSRDRQMNLFAGFTVCALLILLWAVGSNRYYHWQKELRRFGGGVITSELPVSAARMLREAGIEGNFLNPWDDGDYLIWNCWPKIKVAEDGRTAPFPPPLSQALAAIFRGDAAALERFEAQYPIDGAVVPWSYAALMRILADREDWAMIHIGPYATVWMRTASLERQNLSERIIPPDELQRFLVLDPEQAASEEAWLTYSTYVYRRANVFYALRRFDLVRRSADDLLARNPQDALGLRLDDALHRVENTPAEPQ